MENQTKEAWIILYTYRSTDDWIGGFPDTLYEWFVCDLAISKIPRIFDSKKEANQYIRDNFLIRAKAIQVAGDAALVTKPVSSPTKENTEKVIALIEKFDLTLREKRIANGSRSRLKFLKNCLTKLIECRRRDEPSTSDETQENFKMDSILSQLDKMIEQSLESEKIFEEQKMVSSELTSGAMAQAYKNVKNWILNMD